MGVRFLLVPGHITSKADEDRHYISASMLMRLYKVRPEECTTDERGKRGLIKLTPRFHGDYEDHLKLLLEHVT